MDYACIKNNIIENIIVADKAFITEHGHKLGYDLFVIADETMAIGNAYQEQEPEMPDDYEDLKQGYSILIGE